MSGLPPALFDSLTLPDLVYVLVTLSGLIGGTAGVRAFIKYARRFVNAVERFETHVKNLDALTVLVGSQEKRLTTVEDHTKQTFARVGSVDALLKGYFELLNYGVLVAEGAGQVIYANNIICNVTGRQRDDLLGQAWKDSVHENYRQNLDRAWEELVLGHRSVYLTSVKLVGTGGETRGVYRLHVVRKRDVETGKSKILIAFYPIDLPIPPSESVPHA